ncbi:8-amino-7-oxononanoate synthase [Cellulophaga sp. RHA19]|uniref:aminotransferase class I/II-fold pyridoxal phosphate-dependent enzyme n=1 Tax=Cellulophaga sp. RHA19 TaxID=1798237 RepID=UPI000C2BA692|nr:pyridoxal phosphate-dependent aminotransferase family protein [Cellulophaga sp. RHA19]PKB42952.1 8-amino-7-oxononanoate synthase [Cellulophaga sp. RHA19]
MLPQKLQKKLEERQQNMSLRTLPVFKQLVDFSSNDYLGFSGNAIIFNATHQYLINHNFLKNGATGSRLLSGNHNLYDELESKLALFHQSKAAIVYNSGYDANIGFFSCVPQRGDLVFYDEYIHASIRDGIAMSNAKSYKFKHNSLSDLEKLVERHSAIIKDDETATYVVTESVFSMDGDSPNLKEMALFCKEYKLFFVVDEAHAVGVFSDLGQGLVQELQLVDLVFARIITFGKALGCHGAAILGSVELKNYLVNFSRSFIYTTALAPHSVASILQSYYFLESKEGKMQQQLLQSAIQFFKNEVDQRGLKEYFIPSNSAIQCCLISGNNKVKSIAKKLEENGFNVKAILSPTVPRGEERLRFCLHAYNTPKEIEKVITVLCNHIKE